MKDRNNKKSNKLRQMLESLNDDGSINKYKEMAYEIGMRDFEKDMNMNRSEDILNMIRKDSDPLKKPVNKKPKIISEQKHHKDALNVPPPKIDNPGGIEIYEDLKYQLEESETELQHTTDLLDGALAQPGDSPELLAYINEMTQVQADIVEDVKKLRLKLGLDRA